VRQSGSASNQYAVWIENAEGKLIKTLYATRWTANGGYKTRPDSIPIWVERSSLSALSSADVDAVAGATPRTVPQSYAWDLTGSDGETAPPGEYRYFVEGTLRWKNQVLYSGIITIGADAVPSISEAVAEYTFEGDGNRPALNESSPEINMLSSVAAEFRPED